MALTRKRKIFNIMALTLIVFCIVYPFAKMKWSEWQVKRFCAQVHQGDALDTVVTRSKEYWLGTLGPFAKREVDGKTVPATLIVWEGWVFDRWFCDVEHEDGKVTGTRVSHLD